MEEDRKQIVIAQIEKLAKEQLDLQAELAILNRDEKYEQKVKDFYKEIEEEVVSNNGICIVKSYTHMDVFNEEFELEECDVTYHIIRVGEGRKLFNWQSVHVYRNMITKGDIHCSKNDYEWNWEIDIDFIHNSFEYHGHQMWHIVSLSQFKNVTQDIIAIERMNWNGVYNEIKDLYPDATLANSTNNANQ